jgi:hypothetical protein
MRTPFRVSCVTAVILFVVTFFAFDFHHNTINGHVLTPMEQLPEALIATTFVSALALLGTWLGLRRHGGPHMTFRDGVVIAAVYILATYLADQTGDHRPRTVTIPSHEADSQSLQFLAMALVWGIGAPFAIANLAGRLKLFRASDT